jgi:hypothetical protein
MRKNDRRAIELRDLAVIVVKARGSFVETINGPHLYHFADDHIRIPTARRSINSAERKCRTGWMSGA